MHPSSTVHPAILVVLAMGIGPLSAQATCPSAPTAERFTLNGAKVTDKKTGLVWARCSIGQSWNGSTCTGSATTHTHEQALQLAKAATGWRLPNVKELSSIADKGCQSPAIDSAAFPGTPRGSYGISGGYWSSSPELSLTRNAWAVDFFDGQVRGSDAAPRGNTYLVRLVWISQ